MKKAVGTSLLVIAFNSFVGFAGYLGQMTIPWGWLAGFSAVAILGIIVGTRLSHRVSQGALKQGFSVLLVAMGVFMVFKNGSALGLHLPTATAFLPFLLPLAGGALIGVSSSVFLLLNGRIRPQQRP
jgi:hypothetical protein